MRLNDGASTPSCPPEAVAAACRLTARMLERDLPSTTIATTNAERRMPCHRLCLRRSKSVRCSRTSSLS